jgi:capsule biosynthesis phosphatase
VIHDDKVLVLDVDGTLCPVLSPGGSYTDLLPNADMVERVRWYRREGYHIVLQTSRNMRTYAGNVGLINANTLPQLIEWLDRHDVPYDEIHVAKPWAGRRGFYVDDRAVRPAEFLAHTPEEVAEIVRRDSGGQR